MQKNKWLLTILFFVLLLAGCGQKIEDPLNWKISDFTFTNQNNESVGLDDLKGDVWLADFIFTNCTTVCLPMTSNMVYIQDQLAAEGLDVRIVSFSVDPAVDTPETLKSYAENYGADLSSWDLLTGYSPETIDEFSMENFKAPARKPKNDDQVIHGTAFYLIDQEGLVKKSYDGVNPSVEDILKDAEILLAEE